MLQSCLCPASIDRWSNKPLTGDADVGDNIDEDDDEGHKVLDDHDEQHQLLSSLVETQ